MPSRTVELDRRRVIRSVVAAGWNGSGTVSRDAPDHALLPQHHITVRVSTAPVTGILRIRARPLGMSRYVDLSSELSAIDVSRNDGTASVIVNGYYDQFSAVFTTALSMGFVDIVVASTGESLSAMPSHRTDLDVRKRVSRTQLASSWAGGGIVSKAMPDHEGLTHHHITLACSAVPSTGVVRVSGRPTGGDGFVSLGRQLESIDLTANGSANLIVTGLYREFRIEAKTAVTGANVDAHVASGGEELAPVSVFSRPGSEYLSLDGGIVFGVVDFAIRPNVAGTDVALVTELNDGTVTSVNVSGGATGMSFTGGPITTSGTITLSGTLDVDNGGTGATTAAGARSNLGVTNSEFGTWTPSFTSVANLDSTPTLSGTARYFRVGDMVTCTLLAIVDPTTDATLTEFRISLPVASNFTDESDCVGQIINASTPGIGAGDIRSDTANDTALAHFHPTDTTSRTYKIEFTYAIL